MPSRRLRALLLGIACAVLLAQHAGIAHAVWHAYQQLPAHEQSTGGEELPYAPEATRLCAFDAVFGQVLGCAPAPENRIAAAAVASAFATAAPHTRATPDTPAPRSRGPPAHL